MPEPKWLTMKRFTVFQPMSAPSKGARSALREIRRQRGHVPNLHGVLALSEHCLRAYVELGNRVAATSLTALERQMVMLQANYHRKAPYCMAGDSAIAYALGIPDAWREALRTGAPVPDIRGEALRSFTRALLQGNGSVTDADWDSFLAAGYTPAQALEVVLALALKTLSNFTSRLADVPLDTAFFPSAWHSTQGDHDELS